MYLPLCSLACGLLSLRFLPQLPSSLFLIIIFVGASFLLLLSLLKVKFLACARYYIFSGFLVVVGFCLACFSAQNAVNDRLNHELDGSVLWLTGTIADLPEIKEHSTTFILENSTSLNYQVPRKIRVSWYQAPVINSGEVWRLAVKLKRPRGLLNPASFDVEAWLTAQRIGATGTVRIGAKIREAEGLNLREHIRSKLQQIKPYGNALAALVVGDKSSLSANDWQLLQATGTVHLMVISGTHIGMLGLCLFSLVKLIFYLIDIIKFKLHKKHKNVEIAWLIWAWLIVAVGAIAYGWLAGFGVPVQRACMMVIIVFVWRLFFSDAKALLVWLIALNWVLIIEPLSSLQAGFWVSFVAVLALIMMFTHRPVREIGSYSSKFSQVKKFTQNLAKAQVAVLIGLLPFLLWLGLPISLSGAFANFIAVPWVGFFTIPLALLGTVLLIIPPIGEFILQLAGYSLAGLFGFLEHLALLIPAWHAPQLAWWTIVLATIGVVLIFSPLPVRSLGLLLLLSVFIPVNSNGGLTKAVAEIWLLDIGQGLGVFIRTQNHALLYDAGANYNGFDRGERVVAPVLWGLNVKKLDLMLISHGDNDHAGGASFIAQKFKPNQIISGEPQRLPVNLNAQICQHNDSWQWDEVKFRVIYLNDNKKGNAASCMLLVEANNERLLLTGDIDKNTELQLLAAEIDVQANWLLAPHHGSKTSSSREFLQATKAHSVLISRGNHNAFGHPHQQVLKRYQDLNLEVFDTVKTGAQQIMLGKQQALFAMRDEAKFWREP